MIVDCFMFCNELQMLYYRLNLLGDIVDYFVIVESRFTHSGKPKELYFQSNKHLFPFQNKIIHIVVDQMPFLTNLRRSHIWANENYQRNMIDQGIKQLNLSDNDLIIVSDVDEIPNPDTIDQITNGNLTITSIKSLSQDFYYYNLNNKINNQWDKSKILPFSEYTNTFNSKPQLCRNFFACPSIANSGWHLSYFGNSQFIVDKLQNFAHQELNNPKNTDIHYIEHCISNNIDFSNRNDIKVIDNNEVPPSFHLFDSSQHLFIR